ncbi:hypothetical protein H6P81_010067 [Aristolochia fimbriata]|uniref:SLH domain-containing protein n=1 Tax=Aristolochia fimbriata TaxID=158543 RepID=A0AAV7ER51_ARIFI|nr:hypothetical protein H6P81_010067 [Aristolochia fimbriata]
MASSRLHFSPFLSSHNHCGFRSSDVFPSRYSNPAFSIERSNGQKRLSLRCSIAERKLGASWVPSDTNADDNCGGWSGMVEEAKTERRKGFSKTLGVGASVAILCAAFVGCSFSGFRYRFLDPLPDLKGFFLRSMSDTEHIKVSDTPEANVDCKPDIVQATTDKKLVDHVTEPVAKTAHVVVPAVIDTCQHEAIFLLKKLKVVEDDVQPDALCTRREYARWLVKTNSLLERIPKHHLSPSMLLAGSVTEAFDDVRVTDPDFWCIQALAEAGIVASKLTTNNPCSDHHLNVAFFPESFISRLDLLNWKVLLEYPRSPEMNQKILRKNVGFIDVEGLNLDVPLELFVDMIAADKSIINRVFGCSRRLQPNKPVTKAQAAVVLASGRMMDLIQGEVSRLEAESYAKQVEIESIKSELLQRGEIQRFWDGKLNEEKAWELVVEREYLVASLDLEKEKLNQDKSLPDILSEEAALDCRKQHLARTTEEVKKMYERINFEKANLESEQQSLVELRKDLQARQKGLDDAKIVMGAEIAALQSLREWIEDEAKEIRTRAKIFEKAAQRWKWGDSFYRTSCKKPAS